ncbi:TetR/AcrR family transcriptional regulator [Leifsonia sp. SIMBA_070]|uniref:TetR/AcrR family transcriptional regulator n=1 Tax=Leifsonia sp. SIMBA_070 TaxID=3085810 RepID=UPI00397E6F5B
MATVKRSYDATARRARAEKVRQELIETARRMLLSDGYAALTVPKVAYACGVSVESVYKRFPGKPALVRAVVRRALEGIGPVAAEARSDTLDAADLAALVRGWGRLTAEVAPRVAPILLLLDGAAGHDPELASLAAELEDDRRSRMADNAARLDGAGHLPPGLGVDAATDILLAYSSPQLYDLLVVRSGWDLEQYADFVSVGIAAHLAR